MEPVINWIRSDGYALVLLGAFVLFWLQWLPRILAPVLAPRYYKLSPRVRSLLALMWPTLSGVIKDVWNTTYTEVIRPIVEETETDLDDKIAVAIDKAVHEVLTKSYGFKTEIADVEHQRIESPIDRFD